MNAPNRLSTIEQVWNETYPNGHTFPNDDERRVFLLETLLPVLSALEPQWGYLLKTDRNPPFIPSDIIMWKDTKEHFDVLTGTGPAWQPDGVMENPLWLWVGGGSTNPNPPGPTPPSETPSGSTIQQLITIQELVRGLQGQVKALTEYTISVDTAIVEALNRLDKQPPAYVGKVFGVTVVLRPQ